MGNAFGGGNKPKKEASTLLQRAIDGDLTEVTHLVATFQSNQTHPSDDDNNDDDASKQLQEFVHQADPQGNNALHGAVFAGHLEIVKYLIEECGADPTCTNGMGCDAMWLSAGYDRVEVLEYLLSMLEGEKRKEALLTTNNSKDTALLAASSRGNLRVCQVLLAETSKVDLRDQLFEARNLNGDTALSVCIAGGHAGDLLDLLLENSSSDCFNIANEKGLTPLLVACERDDVDLCKKLLEKGASLDVQDSKGASPLAVAAFCGNVNVMREVLLDKKKLLERPNTNGCTPLWLAVRADREEVVQLLLDSGADQSKANKDGLTPVGAAIKYKREKISEVLERHVSCDKIEGRSGQEQGTD